MTARGGAGGESNRRPARAVDRRSLLWLSLVFIASRVACHAAGVRFDATPLAGYWQYLDPRLLEHDLLCSLFYLHSQPPLFNLFLGLVLKLSPAPEQAFHGLYLVAGLVCQLGAYALMRALAVGRVTAGVVSTVLVLRPSFLLFESWLMYDVPVTALICLAAVWLGLFGRRGSARYAHAFFVTLLLLCAARSLFHLVYFVAAVALTAGVARGRRRRTVLRAAAVPLVLLVSLYVKSFLLFGHWGLSTWLGMNLARIATAAAAPEELARLERQGLLSETATIPPFSPLERYRPELLSPPRHPGVPALAERVKSTGGVNYNHEAYVGISASYLKDALWLVAHRPGLYLHGLAKAWYNYLKPQTEISHVSANRARLAPYVAVSHRLLYGRLPLTVDYRGEAKPVYLFSTAGVPLAILYLLALALRARDPTVRPLLAFMAWSVLYVALAGNALEVWENQRFRFYTDPFLAVAAGVAADRAIRRLRARAGE